MGILQNLKLTVCMYKKRRNLLKYKNVFYIFSNLAKKYSRIIDNDLIKTNKRYYRKQRLQILVVQELGAMNKLTLCI